MFPRSSASRRPRHYRCNMSQFEHIAPPPYAAMRAAHRRSAALPHPAVGVLRLLMLLIGTGSLLLIIIDIIVSLPLT